MPLEWLQWYDSQRRRHTMSLVGLRQLSLISMTSQSEKTTHYVTGWSPSVIPYLNDITVREDNTLCHWLVSIRYPLSQWHHSQRRWHTMSLVGLHQLSIISMIWQSEKTTHYVTGWSPPVIPYLNDITVREDDTLIHWLVPIRYPLSQWHNSQRRRHTMSLVGLHPLSVISMT